MPQFKARFLGLKQELLGRRQPVSYSRGETERSQQHHCPLGNSPCHKLQFSMGECRSPFSAREKGNANKAPVFNGTLSKSQILLLHSPSLHKKIFQPTQTLQYDSAPSKKEVVQQHANGATTHSPNSSISLKHPLWSQVQKRLLLAISIMMLAAQTPRAAESRMGQCSLLG